VVVPEKGKDAEFFWGSRLPKSSWAGGCPSGGAAREKRVCHSIQIISLTAAKPGKKAIKGLPLEVPRGSLSSDD